mmetsp:Transcript_2866/g.4849  ORF Transcript_2866/g.4849 Transcript_2866/m.4849 type:complete len:207 (-) Transcript_2866:94-714(-)
MRFKRLSTKRPTGLIPRSSKSLEGSSLPATRCQTLSVVGTPRQTFMAKHIQPLIMGVTCDILPAFTEKVARWHHAWPFFAIKVAPPKELRRSDVAAIYNVCTSANHRRKGLAKTMTLFAMEEAKKMGCKQVILEASKEGKPLYQTMGFVSMVEEVGGIYLSLSGATVDFKWKSFFRVFELWLRLKNGGLVYYPAELWRMLTKKTVD